MSGTEERGVEETQQEMSSTADEMAERSERLGDQIESTKQGWEQAKGDSAVPTAAGDWEDSEPDDSTGEDPSGFDDPEDVDLDEDLDDEDEERQPDE
jgi:hypothetical protein